MARWKNRGTLFVILIVLTFSISIECKQLLNLSETETTSDEGENSLLNTFMSDQGEHKQVPKLEYLDDDNTVSELQKNSVIKGKVFSSSKEAWDAISPKLMCGDDLMKLQLSGPGADQVELCRRNAAPVLLNRLPPHCGHTTATSGGLDYATPYDGCGVAQQKGNFVIRMLWQGNPVVIHCPLTAADTFMPASPSLTEKPQNPFFGQYPGFPDLFYPHHHHGRPEPIVKPVPTTAPTVAHDPTQKPQYPWYPNMFWPYYYHHHGRPNPTQKPVSTTTPTVAHDPTQKPQYPWYPNMFWPYYYHHHGRPRPTQKPVLTTTPTVAHDPTQKPQYPWYPNMFWPYYYHNHGWPRPTQKPVPTTVPTVAQDPTQKPQVPWYPDVFWPYYYHHPHHGWPKPTQKPLPTTAPTVAHDPTQKPQVPWDPNVFWPYYYYYYYHHHGRPKPTERPVPTTTPKVAHDPNQRPQVPWDPSVFWPYYFYQYQMQPPTTSPITTTPQPCTTTAASECSPIVNELHENPIALNYVDHLEYDPQAFPFKF
ncbi:uncharacterized protein [Paramisgurnus dabryanus]|uniref:uncharacterized protein n=1 Tax=Paramisgurnus dabryanus TaxID=90735 RepID=UPI0031F3DC33